MKPPGQTELFEAVDTTWAPLAIHDYHGWLIREGAGGGQRVSSATQILGTPGATIKAAEKKMASLRQNPLFMIKATDNDLDIELAALGYKIVDPVAILIARIDNLQEMKSGQDHRIARLVAPDNNAKSIWATGGIDHNRLNVMKRVAAPKITLSANNKGVAFVVTHDNIAMVHAVEVAKSHRRKGVANALMYEACHWAREMGCKWISVLTVRQNIPAIKLYKSLEMVEAAAYHYRIKPPE